MENIQQKVAFLKTEYINALRSLDSNAPRKWGKMNVQQMIEHMSDYVRIASGRTPMQIVTPAEQLERMQGFLASEKPFRENTPNALMSEEPSPERHATKEDAIDELQSEINYFFNAFANEPEKKLDNPFFGTLGYEQQVQLLYKHATHHLRQFGMDY